MKRIVANLFLLAGLVCIGLCGYWYVSSELFQYYEGRRFDQERAAAVQNAPPRVSTARAHNRTEAPAHLDSTLGRLSIPRLKLNALVSEGIDDGILRHSVGHMPGTALPGTDGNVVIAGHRDTFFRSLKGLERHDEIVFTTLRGTYRYVVSEMEIVEPTDVAVLAPTADKMLTIVTCYPFNYIGPAPRRFIIRARQLEPVSSSSLARRFRRAPAGSSHPE